jgi:hypothetical protein
MVEERRVQERVQPVERLTGVQHSVVQPMLPMFRAEQRRALALPEIRWLSPG